MKQWELTGITIDVTGKGMPEEVPARGGDTFRLLIDQCPALIWTTDASLVFTSSLGGGLAILGIGPNQLVGVSLTELLDEEDRPDSLPLVAHRRALQGETVHFEMEWGDLALRARVGPLRDARGACIGTVCVALDATRDLTQVLPPREAHIVTTPA